MNVTFFPSAPAGLTAAPASKSHAIRLLIAASLAAKPTVIRSHGFSDDVTAAIRSLRALGAGISEKSDGLLVRPIREMPDNALLDCGESAAVLRFLLPVAASLRRSVSFQMHGRLAERPHGALLDCLTAHGVTVSGHNPLELNGRFTGGDCSLDGSLSSQYASGILLAAPRLDQPTVLTLTGPVVSRSYLDLTLSVMRQYGITVQHTADTFTVLPQAYRSPGSVSVEGDWSGAANLLAMGALSPDGVTVSGLDPASAAGDRVILDHLRSFGADVDVQEQSITVRRADCRPFDADAADCPDLVPVLAVLAAAAHGDSVIRHIGRLRLKESDRVESLAALLRDLGGIVTVRDDDMVVNGSGSLKGGVVSSYHDHRIVMAAALASVLCAEPVTVTDADCIRKSWPGFFAACETLGIPSEAQV